MLWAPPPPAGHPGLHPYEHTYHACGYPSPPPAAAAAHGPHAHHAHAFHGYAPVPHAARDLAPGAAAGAHVTAPHHGVAHGWHGDPTPPAGSPPGQGHSRRPLPPHIGGHQPRYIEDVAPPVDRGPAVFAEDIVRQPDSSYDVPPYMGDYEDPYTRHPSGNTQNGQHSYPSSYRHGGYEDHHSPHQDLYALDAPPGAHQQHPGAPPSKESYYSHHSGQSNAGAGPGPPSHPSGQSQRRPAPRPPASDDHHRLPPQGPPPPLQGSAASSSRGSTERARQIDGFVVQRMGKTRRPDGGDKRSGLGGPPGAAGDPMHMPDVKRLAPSPQHQCGQARLKLRQQFNRNEIDVAKVIRNYDVDHDWKLELDEFRVLLQDYNRWFKHITPEELGMVMQLADIDHDDCIEPNEVMYALRVWYAYVNLPRSASGVLASLGDCPMPSPDVLHEALLLLNEGQPVTEEEVDFIRQMAFALGGAEHRVSAKQMRMAVATWYLNIERRDTAKGDLAMQAMSGAHDHICRNNPIQRFCRGDCDPVTMACMGVITVVWLVVPALSIWIGTTHNTSEWPCNRPSLSVALLLTGCVCFMQGLAVCWLTAAWECTAIQSCRMAALTLLGVVTAIGAIFWIIGLLQVVATAPSECGFLVWEFGNFVWVFQPVIIVLFTSCCLPALYCSEYYHNKRVDAALMGGFGGSASE